MCQDFMFHSSRLPILGSMFIGKTPILTQLLYHLPTFLSPQRPSPGADRSDIQKTKTRKEQQRRYTTMPSPNPQARGDNNSSRELSPYFSLPNEDGESNGGEVDQIQCPPVTVSCANCERIVGDSSAFLYATRQMGTITLSSMVSVVVGEGGLRTSLEGEWDEFWFVYFYLSLLLCLVGERVCADRSPSNYKNITCGKCEVFLGKMYMATTAKLSTLQSAPPSLPIPTIHIPYAS